MRLIYFSQKSNDILHKAHRLLVRKRRKKRKKSVVCLFGYVIQTIYKAAVLLLVCM